jgi:hypothetical protein
MLQPRVYLYKITFEEIPDWYWGIHKEKTYGETYLGSPVTHAWKWDFYTPHLNILHTFSCSGEGWAEAREMERRVIKPDLNNPLCLNENCGLAFSLESCRMGSIRARESITLDAISKRNEKVKKSWEPLTTEERRERTGWKGGLEKRQQKAKELAEKSAQKTRKKVKVVTPEGETHTFEGLNEAARQLNLSAGNLCAVLKGQRNHTKGFTASYEILQ